jgi:hypothetical protein
MKPSTLASTLVLSAALLSAGTASAAPTYYDNGSADSVNDYENQRDAYYAAQDDYGRRQADYERQRADYERAQREYDRRYGYGAYSRQNGAFDYNGPGRGAASSYDCSRQRSNSATAGGIIGALAGAAIGSNVAGRGVRTEGAVLGAIVGGAAGVAIGRNSAQCDARGYYYSYNDTRPYREPTYGRGYRSGRYDSRYYANQRCRLAVVEYGGAWRYARVCPDSMGRYRFTG